MKKFIEPAAGTVRGPFVCGKGNDSRGGIQFLVKQIDGAWSVFIGTIKNFNQLQKDARDFAKTQLAKATI